jgi:hypothetical protein
VVALPLDDLHILGREAGFPANGGQQGAEPDAALESGGFLQDVADLGLRASAVFSRMHAQCPMRLLRQVAYGQSGHPGTSFPLQAMLSLIRI